MAKAKPKHSTTKTSKPARAAAPGRGFPEDFPALELQGLYVAVSTGRFATRETAEAGWWLVGYALGKALPAGGPELARGTMPDAPPEGGGCPLDDAERYAALSALEKAAEAQAAAPAGAAAAPGALKSILTEEILAALAQLIMPILLGALQRRASA